MKTVFEYIGIATCLSIFILLMGGTVNSTRTSWEYRFNELKSRVDYNEQRHQYNTDNIVDVANHMGWLFWTAEVHSEILVIQQDQINENHSEIKDIWNHLNEY